MAQLDQKIDEIQMRLLAEVADLHQVPSGAFNLRSNGQTAQRTTTANIDIVSKEDGTGIDIKIKPHTVHESVHIPVVLSQSGLTEMVYNDFYVGEGADVVIVAGCGIHNSGDQKSEHDGIHRFFIGKNAKVKYVEKHYGSGDGRGERILNPTTEITMEEGSYLEMESVQIKGVDSTDRKTSATLERNAKLVIKERLLTHGTQEAKSTFVVDLNGEDSSANVISRSVAKEESHQIFISRINGNTRCAGHTECDAIIMDHARIEAVPELTANNVDAALIHEAAIGKIAGEQIIKLMTLGLTEEEAEAQIVNGFLK
jgi:Fe-S cluster assembly scaffold protein SufB